MKDTIFEIKQSATRENITFHFQTNDQFDAIKDAIVRKFNNKRRLSTSSSVEGSSPIHLQHHIGGLPSPPVEEKKVTAILPSLKPSKQQEPSSSPLLSSQEIREKIQYLKDEKHRLFQLIKQMMMEEESRKRKAKAEEQSLQQRQVPPLPQSAPATPPAQQQPKKKSRWGAPAASASASPFYSSNNNQSSYFCSRPTPSTSRYNSSHPYSNQQRPRQHPPQHHYSLSRPPYSR
ncbi:hypothetical protein PS15m_008227 [Mucor circinelloides]